MNTISTEDVRSIVREENKHLEKSMCRLVDSVEKMVTAVNELASQSKVTEEKFTRVHERIDDTQERVDQANKGIMAITTEILPSLEAEVAVNSFSSSKMWKVAFIIAGAIAVPLWGVIERFNSLQAAQMQTLIEALKGLGKVVGN